MKRKNFLLAVLIPVALPPLIRGRVFSKPRTGRGFKVSAGEARFGKRITMKGITPNTLDIKISAKDTDGELAVFQQTGTASKGGPPLHIHPYQDEWFYILEGKYQFQIGDDKYSMQKGDTIFLPRNVPHAFVQLTPQASVIVSYLPGGKMEAFFEATSKWETPPSKEEIVQVFADHDMKVVGPPLRVD